MTLRSPLPRVLVAALCAALLAGSCSDAPSWAPAGTQPLFELGGAEPAVAPENYNSAPAARGTVTSGDNLIKDLALTNWGGGLLVEDLLGSPQFRMFRFTGEGAEDMTALNPSGEYNWVELFGRGDELWVYQGASSRISLERFAAGGERRQALVAPERDYLGYRRGYLFDLAPSGLTVYNGSGEELGALGREGETPLEVLGWSGENTLLTARGWRLGEYNLSEPSFRHRADLSRRADITGELEAGTAVPDQRLAYVSGGLSPSVYLYDFAEGDRLWSEDLPESHSRYRLYPLGDSLLVAGYQASAGSEPGVALYSFSLKDGSQEFTYQLDGAAYPIDLTFYPESGDLMITELHGLDPSASGYPELELPHLLPPGPDPALTDIHTRVTRIDAAGERVWRLGSGDADLILPLNRKSLVGVNLGNGVFPAGFRGFSTADGKRQWQIEADAERLAEFSLADPWLGAVYRERGNFRARIYRFPGSAKDTDNSNEAVGN